ncbi:alpha/beta-hydrolase [Parathielavia appendiculata]|uniref:Alpha/beta-hydrolase n=1 Tax=Parathielavia appendiculata TaxID=2587402 RepID=A0AAN6TR29_9PEZI|nr:alpha/beta-hydrolase [Parathielavia appendiculata]
MDAAQVQDLARHATTKTPFPVPVPRRRPTVREAIARSLIWVSLWSIFYYSTIPFIRSHLPFHHAHDHERDHGSITSPCQTPALTYPGERIAWTPCGDLANRTLECANLTVPMDHFIATNNLPDDKFFTIPLIRLRSPNATQTTRNLLLNPGGPGASGTELVYRRGAQVAAIVGDGFHLVGFDPRGVNQSTPLATCYPTVEARRELSTVRDKKLVEDSGELWAWTANFVRACADTMGEHGKYVNTPQTAADMNLILDALGQEGMYYWGFSYGTLLGQTYATMFPERAERVIIDGVANQFDWYEALLDGEMMTDTDRVFEGFIEECVKAGEEDCALAGLAETKEELWQKVVEGLGKLKDDPIPVYVNNTVYGVLDYWTVWNNGVFPALYKPANWRDLASNLAALLRGNGTAAFLDYQDKAWESVGDALEFIALNDGTSGPAYWSVDRRGLVDLLQPYFNQSMFAETELDFYFPKSAWSIPRTHNYIPKRNVTTAHPLLLLSTTYDPVCPLISARSASDAFEGSRIVEVKGYGHCSPAIPSLCVARHVRNYLYEGKLPDSHVQCDPDGKPYFSKPDDTLAFMDTLVLGNEERRIVIAQQELARDSWPMAWRR